MIEGKRYARDWSAVDAMREAFESDAAVTYAAIAEATGLTERQVANYANREGWRRPAGVHRRSRQRSGAVGGLLRWSAPPKPVEPVEVPRVVQRGGVVTSVFDLGTGRRVTTCRNHAEVRA